MSRRGRKKAWVKQLTHAGQRLLPTFKSSWPYTLLGLILGVSLVLAGEGLDHSARARTWFFGKLPLIVEHIGMGFIVAALAVFFYEWGAHVKSALDLSERLYGTLKEMVPIVRATGEAALREGLDTLLPSDSSARHQSLASMTSDIQEIVKSVGLLEKDGIWIKDQYLHYLATLLAVVRQNASCLGSLGNEGPHDLEVASAEFTDKLLVAQIQALEEGDSYDVITNLESWRYGRLPEFSRETREAVRRGVQVRRIFNCLFRVHDLRPEEVQQIFSSHLADLRALGENFQVRVLGPDELMQSASPELQRYASFSHFGIFSHGDERLRISLSSLELSKISMTTTRKEIEFSSRLFEEAWKVAQPLTEDLLKASQDDLLRELLPRPPVSRATPKKAGPVDLLNGAA
jgi:hypothetical protein